MNIHEFWKAVLVQDENEIRKYFHEDAYVNWHCTNEHFNLDEYWADDSDAPQWRLDKHIGTVIKCEPDRDGDFRLFS